MLFHVPLCTGFQNVQSIALYFSWVMQAMKTHGFVKDVDGIYQISQSGVTMKIPTNLIPKCPDGDSDVTANLRADDSFVEDEGWHRVSSAYPVFALNAFSSMAEGNPSPGRNCLEPRGLRRQGLSSGR